MNFMSFALHAWNGDSRSHDFVYELETKSFRVDLAAGVNKIVQFDVRELWNIHFVGFDRFFQIFFGYVLAVAMADPAKCGWFFSEYPFMIEHEVAS